MKKIELFSIIKEIAQKRGSLYVGRADDRIKLLEFLEMNDFFGLCIPILNQSDVIKKIYLDEKQVRKLCKNLELWLDAFKRSNREKLKILLEYGEKIFPQTITYYREFTEEQGIEDNNSTWQLLDFLLFHMNDEIIKADVVESRRLVEILEQEATRIVGEVYTRFRNWLNAKLKISGWQYKFEYRKREDIGAYTLQQFSGMAYCIFNETYWNKQNLVKNACTSAIYANLWAFIAMHFVCGLRSTDIVRIPKPELPESGESFRKKALEGIFVEPPEMISQDIQIRLRYQEKKPNKTKTVSGVPSIKVFIPRSLEKPLGIILGIAASFCEDIVAGNSFLRSDRNISHTRNFFGEDFMTFLKGKSFSSSRANKAYLQGLEIMSDSSEGSTKGYMIAALARSHKQKIDTIPDITDVYLKDATFSRYKPEFIAREMFERGVFGFVPHLLIKAYAGDDYANLPLAKQTMLLKTIGIKPSGIEKIVAMCEISLLKAKDVVSEVISSETNISFLLQEIASGKAVGKQYGCLCVMVGSGFSCPFPNRIACIGCRYEIHTKSILHLLSKEYARMRKLLNEADGWRYRAILRGTILPIIAEYLACVKNDIIDADMNAISEIMEGGLSEYAFGNE